MIRGLDGNANPGFNSLGFPTMSATLGNIDGQTFTLLHVYRANEVGVYFPLTRVSKGYRLSAF